MTENKLTSLFSDVSFVMKFMLDNATTPIINNGDPEGRLSAPKSDMEACENTCKKAFFTSGIMQQK